MTERVIVKNFNNFLGRDTRSSDLVRDRNYAIEFQNARVVKEDSCLNREGAKIRAANAQFTGLYTYHYSNTTTGADQQELVSLSDNLYKKVNGQFKVEYSGSASLCFISILLSEVDNCFCCLITEDGVEVFNYSLGTGLESSPVTLANLKTQIDALSGFSATITGASTSTPAAFLPVVVQQGLISADLEAPVYYWQQVNRVNSIFSNYYSNRGADEFELASCESVSNCLYIATGYNFLHKYDGQNVYRAGLPIPSAAATGSLTGTGITDANIKYIYLYKQVDNQGNEILGVDSDPSANFSPSNQSVQLTLQTVQAASGYNTNCALVNGNQTGVTTITVTNSPHTLRIGDTAYFLNRVSGQYVERRITNTTSTSITIEGTGVNVNNSDVISCNLRIAIYRSTNGGNLYYRVAEIPNNSFASTQTYTDGLLTASLGAQYFPPTRERDVLEVKPRYLKVHQNLLIAAGAPETPNTWYFSSDESPEYFPAESNFEDIKDRSGGAIRGIGSDQEHLCIGTDRAIYVVTGDIYEGTARQEKLGKAIGFGCHNSIVDMEDRIIFLSKNGFYQIQGGFNLQEIGAPINSMFRNPSLSDARQPKIKRAMAVRLDDNDEYVCFIPTETGSGTARYANNASTVQVFDSFHGSWSEWTGLNMGGGMTVFNNKLFFQSRREDPSLTVTGNLWESHSQGNAYDYADHTQPIAFKLGTQWIDGGEPSVFKVFLWLKLYNLLRAQLSASYTITVSVERDFRKDVEWFRFPIDFSAQGGSGVGWGLEMWSFFPWGNPKRELLKKKLRSGKAQSLRYVMTAAELHKKIAISAWETVVTAPYANDMKD